MDTDSTAEASTSNFKSHVISPHENVSVVSVGQRNTAAQKHHIE